MHTFEYVQKQKTNEGMHFAIRSIIFNYQWHVGVQAGGIQYSSQPAKGYVRGALSL